MAQPQQRLPSRTPRKCGSRNCDGNTDENNPVVQFLTQNDKKVLCIGIKEINNGYTFYPVGIRKLFDQYYLYLNNKNDIISYKIIGFSFIKGDDSTRIVDITAEKDELYMFNENVQTKKVPTNKTLTPRPYSRSTNRHPVENYTEQVTPPEPLRIKVMMLTSKVIPEWLNIKNIEMIIPIWMVEFMPLWVNRDILKPIYDGTKEIILLHYQLSLKSKTQGGRKAPKKKLTVKK